MAKETAEKVEALELLLAKGKRKGCDLSDSIDKTILEYTKRQK
jgi:hypothetical protein